MEVRFRPAPPSTLARRTNPARPLSEDGLSFLEVIDSVTGAENNSEENTGPGTKQHAPTRQTLLKQGLSPAEEPAEAPPANPAPTPETQDAPAGKKLGTHIDMTA